MSCLICKREHSTEECRFPEVLNRCADCYKILFHDSNDISALHECEDNVLTSYRNNVLAKPCEVAFRIRYLKNDTEMYYFQNNAMQKFEDNDCLLSSATFGILKKTDGQAYTHLIYESFRNIIFNIGITVMDSNSLSLTLQCSVTPNGVYFYNINEPVIKIGQKLHVPNRLKFNTAFLLGVKSISNQCLEFQFRSERTRLVQTFKFDGNTWKFDQELPTETHPVQNNAMSPEICGNCGNGHHSDSCEWPSYIFPCAQCLAVSFDGNGHVKPCMPINRKSKFRCDIMASPPLKLFELSVLDSEANVAYLNGITGQFTAYEDSTNLISQATDGMFSLRKNSALNQITYKCTSFARFSFLIAVLDNGLWRVRLRVVMTPVHGMLVFKCTTTLIKTNGRYDIPDIYRNNSNAIIGIQPKSNTVTFNCQIMANDNGNFDESFRGYEASFVWMRHGGIEDLHIDQLLHHKTQIKRSYNKQLYRRENAPLSTFQEQRTGNIALPLM